ncbi:hypothetical protein FGO68_gene3661 [Halteria grandinella]|uniref:Uncharacterized protein n=1 Tax=Halteria grandinella TaxID=5974 RepID=A0A8J8NWY0_HALGN|nr:hypothetical protein FGO68_gene3661 [Halteria grandinella]
MPFMFSRKISQTSIQRESPCKLSTRRFENIENPQNFPGKENQSKEAFQRHQAFENDADFDKQEGRASHCLVIRKITPERPCDLQSKTPVTSTVKRHSRQSKSGKITGANSRGNLSLRPPQRQLMASLRNGNASPRSDKTITTISHVDDIYSANYWQKQVSILLKEKKGMLKMSQDSHFEIRKMHEENENLQTILRHKEQELDHMKFGQVLEVARHKKGALSQTALPQQIKPRHLFQLNHAHERLNNALKAHQRQVSWHLKSIPYTDHSQVDEMLDEEDEGAADARDQSYSRIFTERETENFEFKNEQIQQAEDVQSDSSALKPSPVSENNYGQEYSESEANDEDMQNEDGITQDASYVLINNSANEINGIQNIVNPIITHRATKAIQDQNAQRPNHLKRTFLIPSINSSSSSHVRRINETSGVIHPQSEQNTPTVQRPFSFASVFPNDSHNLVLSQKNKDHSNQNMKKIDGKVPISFYNTFFNAKQTLQSPPQFYNNLIKGSSNQLYQSAPNFSLN